MVDSWIDHSHATAWESFVSNIDGELSGLFQARDQHRKKDGLQHVSTSVTYVNDVSVSLYWRDEEDEKTLNLRNLKHLTPHELRA